MKITVILNYKKSETVKLAEELIAFLAARDCELKLPEGKPGFAPADCENLDFSDCELGILLGGDGTLLDVAHNASIRELPLLTVNMGKVGFLAELEKSELFPALEHVFAREYRIEERPLLQMSIVRDEKTVATATALNDFVLDAGTSFRSITVTTEIDGEFVSTIKTTGMIFASPTGSTAYSLSAGGPIIMPQSKVLLLTPLAAHDLYARPIVMPSTSSARILFSGTSSCRLIADGQAEFGCGNTDELFFASSPCTVKLLRLKKAHFFTSINEKLIRRK